MDRDRILEPRAVEAMIAEGHTIVIFEDVILKLDSWLHRHPGGRLAILHMVGRDATDEMKAYVNSVSGSVLCGFDSVSGSECCLASSSVSGSVLCGFDSVLWIQMFWAHLRSVVVLCCLTLSYPNPYPAAPAKPRAGPFSKELKEA